MRSIVIIGGGFFGLYLAEHCAKLGHTVKLYEKESEFMSRASYANQARIHNGYHYPRSMLTALRSRISFPRFVEEFKSCIDSGFEKYYLVGQALSKVSAKQFQKFCDRIDAPCNPAPYQVQKLVNPSLVEACFSTVEYAFESFKLRDIMLDRLIDAKVELHLETSVEQVSTGQQGLRVHLHCTGTEERQQVHADHVFNCTYSRINQVVNNSGIAFVPLKHEMTEMCLVDVPEELKKMGLTIMCGPFFSVMPFPTADLHSFSHVRYTPHYDWHDGDDTPYLDADEVYKANRPYSAWNYMKKDAARYVPLLNDCVYRQSIWEVKTILPRSESDDSRPILFLPNYGLKGFHCIMGGKIDNVYDVVEAITYHNILS